MEECFDDENPASSLWLRPGRRASPMTIKVNAVRQDNDAGQREQKSQRHYDPFRTNHRFRIETHQHRETDCHDPDPPQKQPNCSVVSAGRCQDESAMPTISIY